MCAAQALHEPQTSLTAWYQELEDHIRTLGRKGPPANIENYPSLLRRVQNRRKLHGQVGFDAVKQWFERFLEERWFIDLAFLVIDCSQLDRLRFLNHLRWGSRKLCSKLLSTITRIQCECHNKLDLFSTVATECYLNWLQAQHKVDNSCSWCKKPFNVGRDMKWTENNKQPFHLDCLDAFASSNPHLWRVRLDTPCLVNPTIFKCSICAKSFKMGDYVRRNSCKRHACHETCLTLLKKQYGSLMWVPIECECIPKTYADRINYQLFKSHEWLNAVDEKGVSPVLIASRSDLDKISKGDTTSHKKAALAFLGSNGKGLHQDVTLRKTLKESLHGTLKQDLRVHFEALNLTLNIDQTFASAIMDDKLINVEAGTTSMLYLNRAADSEPQLVPITDLGPMAMIGSKSAIVLLCTNAGTNDMNGRQFRTEVPYSEYFRGLRFTDRYR